MKLTTQQVPKVANLANLPIDKEHTQVYADQISQILDYFEKLNEINTDNIEPTFNTTGLTNILRPDDILPSLDQSEVLKNAASQEKGYFVTKGVFEEE